MPVSLGYIPEGEVLLEPSNPTAPLPEPPINPVRPQGVVYPDFRDSIPQLDTSPRRCTQQVGSVRNPVTGQMVRYTDGCQRDDILAGRSLNTGFVPATQQQGEAGGLVDQSSANALVELVNQTGEDATMRMAEGIVTRYLEGVAMGAILFDSAVSQKLFDINADKMSCAVSRLTSFTPIPKIPAYPKKYVELFFLSEQMDQFKANQKFRKMFGLALDQIVAKYGDVEGDFSMSFPIESMQAEKDLYTLVQKASTDSSFGAEVVVNVNPNYLVDRLEKNQIENNKIQAVQTADAFISKNVGVIPMPTSSGGSGYPKTSLYGNF